MWCRQHLKLDVCLGPFNPRVSLPRFHNNFVINFLTSRSVTRRVTRKSRVSTRYTYIRTIIILLWRRVVAYLCTIVDVYRQATILRFFIVTNNVHSGARRVQQFTVYQHQYDNIAHYIFLIIFSLTSGMSERMEVSFKDLFYQLSQRSENVQSRYAREHIQVTALNGQRCVNAFFFHRIILLRLSTHIIIVLCLYVSRTWRQSRRTGKLRPSVFRSIANKILRLSMIRKRVIEDVSVQNSVPYT